MFNKIAQMMFKIIMKIPFMFNEVKYVEWDLKRQEEEGIRRQDRIQEEVATQQLREQVLLGRDYPGLIHLKKEDPAIFYQLLDRCEMENEQWGPLEGSKLGDVNYWVNKK